MAAQPPVAQISAPLPRVTIQFCTQCKWMLRAAYLAQELLSTFSLSLGEVALQPATGGTFVVTIHHQPSASPTPTTVASSTILWDRKVDGGFPETKELKRRVRDVIEPGRDLGHVDRDHRRAAAAAAATTTAATTTTVSATNAHQSEENKEVNSQEAQQQQQEQEGVDPTLKQGWPGSEALVTDKGKCEDCI